MDWIVYAQMDAYRKTPEGSRFKMSDKYNSSNREVENADLYTTQETAIDLSIKKPRCTSPPPPRSNSSAVKPATPSKLESLQMTQEAAYAEHQAQLQQMVAASGMSDLSFSLAAAALLPPMYDGVTGLFYPPSALAAMAAASSAIGSHSSPPAATGRPRGRRRGLAHGRGRGRTTSLFISSMMQAPNRRIDDNKKSRGHSRGRGRGRGRGRVGSLSLSYEVEVSEIKFNLSV